ncbi:alpha/beta hydrolase [Alkalihalobacillus oceani]|uniref:Alpha/beta hydrolase n=1 Tax=Halalkalibacter oceani TaxID=1653776 RepID=A0A9X2DSE9_9BACI|nr:alpha/beta hydrolase [Halalkalibacter oceani]MCM3714388.1 alpha/beta hydrolase [Halalkalibacter oceani]
MSPAFAEEQPELAEAIARYRAFYHLPATQCTHQYGYITTTGKQRVFVQRFAPDSKGKQETVLLLHGYLDHLGSLSKTIHFLVEEGYTVVGFDLRGHGLSTGDRATIKQFKEYEADLHCVYEQVLAGRQPVHLLGHSTGATVGLHYLQRRREAFDKVILIAPLLRPYMWRLSTVGMSFGKRYIKKLKRVFTKNSTDQAYLTFTKADPLQERKLPLDWLVALKQMIDGENKRHPADEELVFLMIQGDRDRTVDGRYGRSWAIAHYPQSTFVLMNGGRHQLLNEEAVIRTQTFRLIAHYLRHKQGE